MRFRTGTVGLAMLALLVAAPSALASTASLSGGTTVVYTGDADGETVTLSRYTDTRGNSNPADDIFYYLVGETGITSGPGCVSAGANLSACRVTAGLKRYEFNTADGDDTVRFESSGSTSGGSADLGPGNDRFTGMTSGSSADAVTGADGSDTLTGGAGDDGLDGGPGDDTLSGGPGNDLVGGGDGADDVTGDEGNDGLSGGADNDQVSGQAGDDRVDGGPGDDSLEFAAAGAPAGVGAGADDLFGGPGVDLLSYNDHTTAIQLAIDELPGDGSAGENDNVHGDVETVIGSTLADSLTGSDTGQDLYGHGGNDTIDGLGGADLLNGGTGDDAIRGGLGDDAVEGSAGGDLIDGGPGRDLFEGDNECTALPCTGGAD